MKSAKFQPLTHDPMSSLRGWLLAGKRAALLEYSSQHKRSLSYLTALTYDPDPLIAWRALDASGRVAAQAIQEGEVEWVRNHLLRCQWLLSDESGGIGWRAPEKMGEIVARSPDARAEFIPRVALLLFDMEEEDSVRFKDGHLWVVGRLAQVRPRPAEAGQPWAVMALEDPDSQTRGLGVWCLAQFPPALRPKELSEKLPALLEDRGGVQLFDGENLVETTVAALAGELQTMNPELVNRVAYRGERIVLTSRGRPKAVLVSIKDYTRLQQMELLQTNRRSNPHPTRRGTSQISPRLGFFIASCFRI
jgi:prevent-host-death family protein